ncbi:hypothetical protein GN958_ATG16973, partial [Phytophthora infestans]
VFLSFNDDAEWANPENSSRCLLTPNLKELADLVGSTVFDVQPWQSWGIFGACFYAVIINALRVLGHSAATLSDILPGATMLDYMHNITVKLVPSRVFQCDLTLHPSPPHCLQRSDALETFDWILYQMSKTKSLFSTTREKLQFDIDQPTYMEEYGSKISLRPDFLVN